MDSSISCSDACKSVWLLDVGNTRRSITCRLMYNNFIPPVRLFRLALWAYWIFVSITGPANAHTTHTHNIRSLIDQSDPVAVSALRWSASGSQAPGHITIAPLHDHVHIEFTLFVNVSVFFFFFSASFFVMCCPEINTKKKKHKKNTRKTENSELQVGNCK